MRKDEEDTENINLQKKHFRKEELQHLFWHYCHWSVLW